MISQTKSSCLKHLSRIEGEVRGGASMIETDRYGIEFLTPISAVRAALAWVGDAIVRDHGSHCVENAIMSGDQEQQCLKVSGLVDTLGRMGR